MTMANSPSYEPEEPETCNVCGSDLEWVDCWECGGEGEHDLHEEDPINFSPGEEYETCRLCRGNTGWLECPNVDNHSKIVKK